MTNLEHLNITVGDARASAAWIERVFNWKVRWAGPVQNGAGYTIHIGSSEHYVALYQPVKGTPAAHSTTSKVGTLNHVGLTVADLDSAETKVRAEGFTPTNHADYEPGRRFYFHDHDNVEWELVEYARSPAHDGA